MTPISGEYVCDLPLARLIPSRININKLGAAKIAVLTRIIGEEMRVPIEVCYLTPEFEEYLGADGDYLIVDGHHRVAAAKRAGLVTVPAMVFRYSRHEARLRMYQTNALRGHTQRYNASLLLDSVEIADVELANLTGVTKAEIKKLRELQREERELLPQEEKTEWVTERLVYAKNVEPIIRDALELAQRRYNETRENFEDITDWAGWVSLTAELAQRHPEQFFAMMLDALRLLREQLYDGSVLKGDDAVVLESAIQTGEWLAQSEARGHAFSLICADFLAGANEESYQ